MLLLTLFIVTPSEGFCNCSMFCCTLLYVDSSFAIILIGKRELVAEEERANCFVFVVLWLSVLCVSSSRSMVCEGGISWSTSLALEFIKQTTK